MAQAAEQGNVTVDSRGKWMALSAAFLGWMFDGFEIGMFPLVGPSALDALLRDEIAADPTVKAQWFGVIMSVFLIGAATGGVLFGWLGDRIGRVRAMALSIFVYAAFTGLCGFATAAWQIAVLRFVASLGMGGEWALGVALVTEIWPDRSRAFLAGMIGAAANVGFLLVALLSLVLLSFIQSVGHALLGVGLSEATVATLTANDGWRLLMIAGAFPALLVFFIRLFVPESHKWVAQRNTGAASFWATRDLLGVVIGAAGAAAIVVLWSPAFDGLLSAIGADLTTSPTFVAIVRSVGTVLGLSIALLGYLYPVARYLKRSENAGVLQSGERRRYIRHMLLGACLAGVALLGTWGSLQWAPKWASALAQQLPSTSTPNHAKELTQIASASGAILGTMIAAFAGGWLGRRITYFSLCLLSFLALVYLYQANDTFGPHLLASVFVAGGLSASFYGWFPLYLPELFPTAIRATSQGFAYNFGRILSSVGTLQTAALTAYFARGVAIDRVEIDAFPKAGATLAGIYLIGLLIVWLGPETRGRPLPD